MTQHGHEPPTLAAFVVGRRSDLGLTQAELARKAGVAERTVQNIEAGKRPQPLILAAVARGLETDAEELRRILAAEALQAAS